MFIYGLHIWKLEVKTYFSRKFIYYNAKEDISVAADKDVDAPIPKKKIVKADIKVCIKEARQTFF